MTTENNENEAVEIDWNDAEARTAWLKSQVDAEVSGLKAKRDELLGITKNLQSKNKEFEEAEAARQTEVEIAKAKAKGDYDAALKKSLEAKDVELKAASDKMAAIQNRLKTNHFQREATELLAAEGGIPKLLMPIIQAQTVVEFDEDGETVVTRVRGENGEVDPNLTLKDLIANLKKSEDYGVGFRSGAAAGGGASSSAKVTDVSDNPWIGKFGDKTFNMTKQAKIQAENPQLAMKLKAAAGVK